MLGLPKRESLADEVVRQDALGTSAVDHEHRSEIKECFRDFAGDLQRLHHERGAFVRRAFIHRLGF